MTTKVLKKDEVISAYADDIVVQSKFKQDRIEKLPGCLISARGIEANTEKINAILNMKPLTSRKLAQRLAGRLAALNRFISRSTE